MSEYMMYTDLGSLRVGSDRDIVWINVRGMAGRLGFTVEQADYLIASLDFYRGRANKYDGCSTSTKQAQVRA